MRTAKTDQTGQMPRLIWIFTGHTCYFVGFIIHHEAAQTSSQTLSELNRSYRKFPKYSDTQKNCCYHSKIWTMWLYHRVTSPNDADGMANGTDPDQTAPLGAVWSGKQCKPWSDCSSRNCLIWLCTVCPGLSVRKLRIITVQKNVLGHPIFPNPPITINCLIGSLTTTTQKASQFKMLKPQKIKLWLAI